MANGLSAETLNRDLSAVADVLDGVDVEGRILSPYATRLLARLTFQDKLDRVRASHPPEIAPCWDDVYQDFVRP